MQNATASMENKLFYENDDAVMITTFLKLKSKLKSSVLWDIMPFSPAIVTEENIASIFMVEE
jgi:hypothetical protein